MKKTTITLSATLLVLLVTASCNSAPNNQATQNQEKEHPTMQASVVPDSEVQLQHPPTEEINQPATSSTAAEPVADAPQPTATQNNTHSESDKPSATIPPFKFYKVKSGIAYENQDLPKGRRTMFILFDPGCSHCRIEASELGKNYSKIKDVNLMFVSMNDPALMARFLETFAKELVGKPNVEVLYDRNQEFIQKFHIPTQFPANYIYSKDGVLETYWDGPRRIDYVISQLTK